MKKITIFLLAFFTLIFLFINVPKKDIYALESVNTSEIVMEVNTNRVLCSKNHKNKMYMASTTKILTAIVAIENIDLNKIVKVTKETTGIEGSSIYLEAGELLTVKDLLYGLMLRSGNDCAMTIAKAYNDNIEDFISLMNKTALKIGAKSSNFTNPHGLHDENHYTTAYDLALISCYALKNATFKEIVSTKKVEIPYSIKNSKRILVNKNKMLKNYDGATGIKTGYTKKAGRCLVTSAERDGLELVCVVLNCPSMWQKSADLLDSCFSKYKNYKILESDEILDFITDKRDKKIGVSLFEDVIIPLTEEEREHLTYKIKYCIDKSKYYKSNTIIGELAFYIKNNLIFSKKIYNIIDINN